MSVKKKRNPQDATMRNVRSLRSAIVRWGIAVEEQRRCIDALVSRVAALEAWNIKIWVAGQAAARAEVK